MVTFLFTGCASVSGLTGSGPPSSTIRVGFQALKIPGRFRACLNQTGPKPTRNFEEGVPDAPQLWRLHKGRWTGRAWRGSTIRICRGDKGLGIREGGAWRGSTKRVAGRATRNPETGEPVNKKAVYGVLRDRCYDDEEKPEDTWTHQARNSKKALSESEMVARFNWSLWLLSLHHQAAWFFRRLLWTDICNKILPRTEKKATEQSLARKGPRGWGSSGSKGHSRNLVGKKESLKQNSWGTIRFFYARVLSRGKLSVSLLGEAFPGENPAGAALLVAKVRATLNIHHRGDDQPDIFFTDTGQGFFNIQTGKITEEYSEALRAHGLQAFMGTDASRQPGDLKEMMLHETAVAWITHRLKVTTPARAWEETP